MAQWIKALVGPKEKQVLKTKIWRVELKGDN